MKLDLKTFLLTSIFFMTIFLFVNAYSQSSQNAANGLIVEGRNIYFIKNDRLYRSSDNGSTWRDISPDDAIKQK